MIFTRKGMPELNFLLTNGISTEWWQLDSAISWQVLAVKVWTDEILEISFARISVMKMPRSQQLFTCGKADVLEDSNRVTRNESAGSYNLPEVEGVCVYDSVHTLNQGIYFCSSICCRKGGCPHYSSGYFLQKDCSFQCGKCLLSPFIISVRFI